MDLIEFFLKQGGKLLFIFVLPVSRKRPVLLSGERGLSTRLDDFEYKYEKQTLSSRFKRL